MASTHDEDELEAATRFDGSEEEDEEDSTNSTAKTENVWLANGNNRKSTAVLPDLAAL